jgi:hypothetical protein
MAIVEKMHVVQLPNSMRPNSPGMNKASRLAAMSTPSAMKAQGETGSTTGLRGENIGGRGVPTPGGGPSVSGRMGGGSGNSFARVAALAEGTGGGSNHGG